jgi:Peptidase A4 family
MRSRGWWAIATLGVIVSAVVGFSLANVPAHGSAPGAVDVPRLVGSPTHYGHTALGAGAISAASAIALSCPYSVASQCRYSYNWGGYVVYNSTYSVTKVAASWTVPTIVGATSTTCPDAQMTWDSNSVWIGIDGAFSPTVEQTGTSADCFYGVPQYYAWYEFYPAGSVLLPFTVSPGDHITASVVYAGLNATKVPTFKATLTDTTTGSTYTSPKTAVPGAVRESAEWIDESPYYDGFLGLTHVTSVTFSGATATINGVAHPVGAWGSYNVYWFVMVDYNFPYALTITYVKGEPGKLNTAGNGFAFTWVGDGP